MGDPLTLGLLGVGAFSAYQSARSKRPKEPPPVHTTITKTAAEVKGGGRQVKKYRPAAQMFADDDLRLGMAGRLGL